MRMISILVACLVVLGATVVLGETINTSKKGSDKGVAVEMIQDMSTTLLEPTPRVFRIVDKPNSVVCFAVEARNFNGFSCVHINEAK